jgi:hypothetical protein
MRSGGFAARTKLISSFLANVSGGCKETAMGRGSEMKPACTYTQATA